MTHGNVKGEWIKNETEGNIKAQIAKLERQVKYCQDKVKWYEKELERRKQEGPLGVPLEDIVSSSFLDMYKFGFASEMSRFVFAIRLNDYVKALQKLAKGEQIDIQVLLPLLRKGWVAMDGNGQWYWYECKPEHNLRVWTAEKPAFYLSSFNIKPAENWETSLMECGL